MQTTNASHAAKVKQYFEAPEGYFRRRGFDIRIRMDTVRSLAGTRRFDSALDIGCGNGEISVPLFEDDRCRKLTLLDLSQKMLDLAHARIPGDAGGRVDFVNRDFLAHDFGADQFDLIVCLGVLAHVGDPAALIRKASRLLRSDGLFIVEVTDSYHPVGRVLGGYHKALGWFRPVDYRLNRLRIADVARICLDQGLRLSSDYRYAMPPPGSQRVLSHDSLLRMTRSMFGTPDDNRRRWFGNVAISAFSHS